MKKNTNVNKPSKQRKEINTNHNKEITIILISIIVVLLAVVAVLVYKGTHPKLQDGKQVVASIDGKNFTAEELYKELTAQGGYVVLTTMLNDYIVSKEITDTTEAKQYAESLIAQYELQYKESEISFKDAVISSGYESIEAFKNAIINDYLYNKVGEKYIKESITEKELKKYYEEHVSDELGVKHILIAPEVKDNATSSEKKKAEEDALKKAKEIIKKLDNGEDFEKLAKENSDDTGSASNGGIINNVVKDKYVTEFWNAAEKLEINKYTKEPVKSKFGYHIIYKVSHTEKKSFDEMKDSLYDNVVDAKIQEDSTLINKTWLEIHKKYNLKIEDSSIKNIYDITAKNSNK